MARRGENIHKRKDGRWEGRYIKGRSETGKAIWGYVYAYSYVDAKSALIRKKVKAADYTVPLGAQELTISVLSELWLSTLNDLEDSSIRKNDRIMVQLFIALELFVRQAYEVSVA